MSRPTPPASFSLVHPQLYRSATFTSPHFDFVASLGLETIASLGEDLPSKPLLAWCERNKVRLVHLGRREYENGSRKSWKPIQDELVKDALEFVLLSENQPCLVMDQSGVYKTGILIGCLRKLQGWTLSSILAEYASIAGSRSRGSNEQYIELFDTDLVALPAKDRRVGWLA